MILILKFKDVIPPQQNYITLNSTNVNLALIKHQALYKVLGSIQEGNRQRASLLKPYHLEKNIENYE